MNWDVLVLMGVLFGNILIDSLLVVVGFFTVVFLVRVCWKLYQKAKQLET